MKTFKTNKLRLKKKRKFIYGAAATGFLTKIDPTVTVAMTVTHIGDYI